MAKALSVYIHFPYCLYKCLYCDFNSYAIAHEDIPQKAYVQAVLNEWSKRVQAQEKWLSQFDTIGTVFMGGGTPSLFKAHHIQKILSALSDVLPFDEQVEITLEANPKTIDAVSIAEFKQAGVNRISIGIQSFHREYLIPFGRIHTGEDAQNVCSLLDEGMPSWSADLIYGFPHQTLKQWQSDLETLLSYEPRHLSCYALTLEEGTPYWSEVKKNTMQAPQSDSQADFMEWTYERLSSEYTAYEISNFAKGGANRSRHNMAYWTYQSYVGLGAGAVSFFQTPQNPENWGERQTNFKKPNHYIQSSMQEPVWYRQEPINADTAEKEFVMMGLRIEDGLDIKRFKALFNKDFENTFAPIIANHRELGWLKTHQLALTPAGRAQANRVILDYF